MARSAVAFAPGRVNLLGEHTDYNQGLALPFAVTAGVSVQAAPLSEPRIEALAVDLDEEDSFELAQPPPAEGWRAYVRGAVGELSRAGRRLSGLRVRIEGTIPRGAGLSSSAALEVALILALLAASGAEPLDRTELARLGSRIENEWAGAQTGLLDQLASLYGQEDHALRIDFRSLEITPVPLELREYQLVTLDSGEQHSNASGGYNQRRSECARACALLGIESLREASLQQAEQLPEPLNRRARHVVSANARVDQAIEALRQGDLEGLGELLDRAHASLRDDYEVSTPAVEATVARLKRAGALGARIMGGGFGGSVLGLLPPGARVPEGAVAVSPGPGAWVRAEPAGDQPAGPLAEQA
ncbi:MAG: galactokinase [Solirubrobacterales bacterium]|nr:galactokinase [Solirubrobacterales bacterium]